MDSAGETTLTMELLPEPVKAVRPGEADVVNTTNAVDKDLLKEKEPPRHRKSMQLKNSLKRGMRSIDPLFYATFITSMVMLAVGLFAVHRYNEKLVDGYLAELHAANEEYQRRITADAEAVTNSIVYPVSMSENILSQVETAEDLLVQPQTVKEVASGTEEPFTDLHLMAGEVAALKQLLQEKTQQIEFLSLENHELRLRAEFSEYDARAHLVESEEYSGSDKAQSDMSIAPPEDSLLSEAIPLYEDIQSPEVTTLPDELASRNQASGADLPQFIANGFEAYTAKDFLVASEWYNRSLQTDPNNHDANHGVAATAAALGNYQLATNRYRHLLSIDPDDQLAFSKMLMLSTAENMIETELLSHIDTSNRPAPLYSIAGHYFGQQGRWALARDMYERALAGSAETTTPADYFFNLAVSYEHLGDRVMAVEYYLHAINSPHGATFEREIAVRQLEKLATSQAQ